MKDHLLEIIGQAVKKAFGIDSPLISIDIPRDKNFGDFSTNVAMLLSKQVGKPPKQIAELVIKEIQDKDCFEKVSIAGPGFINMQIKLGWMQKQLPLILKKSVDFGKGKNKTGKVLLEFVSANPTGPLHVGHGRWAVLGDNIANILEAVGYKVKKEFYVNDIGNQVNMLLASVEAAKEGRPTPENGYGGAHIKDLAKEFENNKISLPELLEKIKDQQKQVLSSLGVKFDAWFSESSLHEQGRVKKVVQELKEKDLTYEKDGTIWFKAEANGDDKDRVVVRGSGVPTYFAADIAYHEDKYKRGFDRIINIWGTDHHGYVKRLKIAMQALGFDPKKFEILIGQLVSLFRGGEQVRMSKRTGEMVTLEEVVEETGKDATRFFFSMTDEHTHLNFDLELAKSKTDENPVFYVQYAHARICSIIAEAEKQGIKTDNKKADPSLLKDPSERELVLKLLLLPDEVGLAADFMAPHRLATYAREVATIFHSFYQKCRVISEDKELTLARILLVQATRTCLSNVLKLLGINSPERM